MDSSLDTGPAYANGRNIGCTDRESLGGGSNGTVGGGEGLGGRTCKAVAAVAARTTLGKGVDLKEPQAEGWIGRTPIMTLRNKRLMPVVALYPKELQTRGRDDQEPKNGLHSW